MVVNEIKKHIETLTKEGRLAETEKYYQHGNSTIFQHSIDVATLSCKLANIFHINVDNSSLINGALLHDYHLYNWRELKYGRWTHGFRHPKLALINAKQDFQLTEIEKDVILNHMFPLTLKRPKTKEGWLVCMADKLCAIKEVSIFVCVLMMSTILFKRL